MCHRRGGAAGARVDAQLQPPDGCASVPACARCGTSLAGRRPHARCCSARCRAGLSKYGPLLRADRLASRWSLLPRDFWRTPPTLVIAVAALLGGPFGLDAASAGDDAVAPRWLTPDGDALVANWSAGTAASAPF